MSSQRYCFLVAKQRRRLVFRGASLNAIWMKCVAIILWIARVGDLLESPRSRVDAIDLIAETSEVVLDRFILIR